MHFTRRLSVKTYRHRIETENVLYDLKRECSVVLVVLSECIITLSDLSRDTLQIWLTAGSYLRLETCPVMCMIRAFAKYCENYL